MRIGIITHYYKSSNYGGNLQSYALCDFLIRKGYDAEQICFERKETKSINFYKSILRDIYMYLFHNNIYKKIKIRKYTIRCFNQKTIKHSKKIYNDGNLKKDYIDYDTLITGSDQVWHPSAVCDAYLLNFHDSKIKKISYAASVAQDSIPSFIQERYKKAFKGYCAISVREKEIVASVQSLTDLKVEWTLDPVFLKEKEEWTKLSKEIRIGKKYLFCYFLGDDINHRNIAIEYAKIKGLVIVTLPFLTNKYRKCDDGFGDYLLYDVSPFEFVGLIKDAECIFTDSFHAVAFSIILEKEFVVFERNAKKSMGSRISSITDVAGVSKRYCYDQERSNLDYILKLTKIDYANNHTELDAMIRKSKDFLLTNLGDKKQ